MRILKSYPFPERNNELTEEQIYYQNTGTYLNYNYWYNKILEKYSQIIASQYISIENLLIDSFEFVSPIKSNAKTCSVKFATIIREASNLFEIVSSVVLIRN